jgi:1-pyrroline-5-carboxylate dehydrogenase
MATYSNYLTHKILLEAGLPPSVIQFVPGNPPEVVSQAMSHSDFAGLSFTGSTQVFKDLWAKAATNLNVYKGYPRLVGETGEWSLCVIQCAILQLRFRDACKSAAAWSPQL